MLKHISFTFVSCSMYTRTNVSLICYLFMYHLLSFYKIPATALVSLIRNLAEFVTFGSGKDSVKANMQHTCAANVQPNGE